MYPGELMLQAVDHCGESYSRRGQYYSAIDKLGKSLESVLVGFLEVHLPNLLSAQQTLMFDQILDLRGDDQHFMSFDFDGGGIL
jgi:hypothetical protein